MKADEIIRVFRALDKIARLHGNKRQEDRCSSAFCTFAAVHSCRLPTVKDDRLRAASQTGDLAICRFF